MTRDVEALCNGLDDVGSSYSDEAKANLRRAIAKLERLERINAEARERGWGAMHRAGYYSNKREIDAIKRTWRIA